MRTFSLIFAFAAVLVFAAPSVYAKKQDKGSQTSGKHGGKKGQKIKGVIATAPDASGTFTVHPKQKKDGQKQAKAGKVASAKHSKGKGKHDKDAVTVATTAATKVKIDGQPATIAQLQKGMRVKVKMANGVAKSIKAKSKHAQGSSHKHKGKKSKALS